MPVLKTCVFIASRFREFAEIRRILTGNIAEARRLHLEPINLDDGRASHDPPLSVCLEKVRQSEFLILLIGDTYGDVAPHSTKSFVHLEYEEAVRSDSNTEVLVFYIGNTCNPTSFPPSSDTKLARWYVHLQKNHTIAFLNPYEPASKLADKIIQELFVAVYDRSLGERGSDSIDDEESSLAIDAKAFSDEWDELAPFEAQHFEASGISPLDEELLDPHIQPAAVAAREQQQEATRAINVGDYASAIKHLEESLLRRPVDFNGNYRLAQLLVALRRKDRYSRITQLLQRATNLANHHYSAFYIAACHMLWARAASIADRPEESLSHAEEAVRRCGRSSQTHVELARQYLTMERKDDAVRCLKDAFFVYTGILKRIAIDPVFRAVRARVQRELHREVYDQVAALVDCPGDTYSDVCASKRSDW